MGSEPTRNIPYSASAAPSLPSTAWIGRRVADAEETLFDEGCALCHGVAGGFISEQTGAWVARSIEPVHIVDTWIQNARFSHAAHTARGLECAACLCRFQWKAIQ